MCTKMHEKLFAATRNFLGTGGSMSSDYYAPGNVQISGLTVLINGLQFGVCMYPVLHMQA